MKVIIVGAGITGLTLAYLLSKKGLDITVLEKDDSEGGLAKSYYYNDWSIDIGPHRFHTDDSSVEEFILEDSIDLLLTDQDGVIVTFYENEEDALNNLNALTSPYINTTNPQTIHVRAEIENLGCFSTTTLEISVFNSVGPTGDSDQSFCETVTIQELIVTGDNIQWYDSLEGGNILRIGPY